LIARTYCSASDASIAFFRVEFIRKHQYRRAERDDFWQTDAQKAQASPAVTRGWTYDANGNRQTETGTAASTYSIAPSSNQITCITGALARTYAYDPAGYSTVTATYNNAGDASRP
jgi:hypothetical protein